MNIESILLYAGAFICFVISLKNGISIMLMRNKTKMTEGTVVSTQLAAHHTMKIYNSNRAFLSYYVNGEEMISENSIGVPLSTRLGDKVSIRYIVENPKKLFKPTVSRFVTLFLASVVIFTIGVLTK
jgi:hypothetical protein